jgi:hypothetical protein
MPSAPDSAPPAAALYTVFVDDNFHHMDEEERTTHCEGVTLEEAIAACMALTEGSVRDCAADDGSNTYSMFGEDPWISPRPDPAELEALLAKHPEWPAQAFERGFFSAWQYAALLIEQTNTY